LLERFRAQSHLIVTDLSYGWLSVLPPLVAIGLATLILDLVYPKLDPRITYRRA